MIKQLKRFPEEPVYRPPVTPVCCALLPPVTLHEKAWRERRGQSEPFKCQRASVVEIEGETYCRLHGGHKVLDMFLKGKLAPSPSAREERLFQALLDIAEARVKNAASGFPILGADVARWMENRAQQEIDR